MTSRFDQFDLLRAKVEPEVPRPAVIAIMSSTINDGSSVAAKGLAQSIARTRHSTLLVNTSISQDRAYETTSGLKLAEIAARLKPGQANGSLTNLELNDSGLQKATSQGDLCSGLDSLRVKFEYIIISTEYSGVASFATSILSVADAVIVSIVKGRRQNSCDSLLAAALKRVGKRFLGIVALDVATVTEYSPNDLATDSYFPFNVQNDNETSKILAPRMADVIERS